MHEEPRDSITGTDDTSEVTVEAAAEDADLAAIETAADTMVDPGQPAPDEQAAALDSALEELRGAGTPETEATTAEPAEVVPAEDELADSETVGEAPEPTAHMIDPADAVFVEAVSGGLTWIPFAVYLGLWIVLAGLSAYLLYGASPDRPARWMAEYVPLLWSGVALTALGPVLSVAVWLVARVRRPKSGRRGLFASAMTRGALAAFFGVAIWIATLFVLELTASGGAL